MTFKAKELPLSKIEANPYRNLKHYPIDDGKVGALIESFKSTGVWPNIVARSTGNGSVEIAYGHHRLVAARKHLGKDGKITVQVGKLSNEDMLRIMARENLEEWRSNAAVEHETLRATIDAYGRDEIQLEKPGRKTSKNQIHDACPGGDTHPYTLMSVAKFLGWTKKGDKGLRPNSAAEQAWKALRMMDDGVLKETDFTGLSRDQADQVASHAARKKRTFDNLAQGQEGMAKDAEHKGRKDLARKCKANAKAYRDKGHKVAKEVAKAMKDAFRSGAGVRDAKDIADNAVSWIPTKKVEKIPDVNEFALRFIVSIGRMLTDDKTSKELNELIKYCDYVSDSNVRRLCKSLEKLSERCRKYAAKIERASNAKRKVDNRSQTSRSRRLIAS